MDFRSIAVKARHDLTPDELDRLEDRLYEMNASPDGLRKRGLAGVRRRSGWQTRRRRRRIHLGRNLRAASWVQETYRGKGLGKALVTESTREAKARGCAYIYLATYDFQAPGFYTKLGFETVAEIPNKPLGHTEFVMRLRLRFDGAR